MAVDPVVPSEGWGVLHLFFDLRRDVLGDPHFEREDAARDFSSRLRAFEEHEHHQALTFSVLGHKADIGLMLLGPDLAALDRFSIDLHRSPLGMALTPTASYLSLTELSEYTATEEDERRRLEEEGLAPGTEQHTEALEAFRQRMADYAEHRLHPRLPRRRLLCFYPMSKRREHTDNWYALPFDERKRLMRGHAQVGRRYSGRVLQLITGSVGLDDWEWGVTLLADDSKTLKDIVYEMRFDEVSARFAEFGPFVTGLLLDPDDLLAQHGLLASD